MYCQKWNLQSTGLQFVKNLLVLIPESVPVLYLLGSENSFILLFGKSLIASTV
jgi:hypothetical protein